ncbi:MAG TPA: L-seryl-tRNA(Sec) selenium transferase [Anaerolineales bacterium]|nr:L-seryl-tRNA(Sec) selenium transferase [Anaerolineales bacterium]
MSQLNSLPSVERLLQTDDARVLIQKHGRPLTLDAIRLTLDEVRNALRAGEDGTPQELEAIVSRAGVHLSEWERPSLQSVINGTGVILHTNLGRAPLSEAALHAMNEAAASYSNIEFDLDTGKRGSRLSHVEALLKKLLDVEAAVVVNNNASAVLLVLSALAARKRVVIARSQLVEIGGGFRVPDVMRQSGAKLTEVGTTNKVRLDDYEQAMAEGDGLVMHVHRSNFKIVGFTEEPSLVELAHAAHSAGRLLIDDLGSGAVLDTAKYGLPHEPTVQESLAAGADVVCFSGDKLLGGPQSGIIIGRAELIQKAKKHPLARAIRADKTCLAGLAATLLHYLRDEAERELPIWQMICLSPDAVRARAQRWCTALGIGAVVPGESTVGGGSLPGEALRSYALALDVKSPDKFLQKLRMQSPPIIARTEENRVVLDPRTVLQGQEEQFLRGLRAALQA